VPEILDLDGVSLPPPTAPAPKPALEVAGAMEAWAKGLFTGCAQLAAGCREQLFVLGMGEALKLLTFVAADPNAMDPLEAIDAVELLQEGDVAMAGLFAYKGLIRLKLELRDESHREVVLYRQ
jgi:hypothetical protein